MKFFLIALGVVLLGALIQCGPSHKASDSADRESLLKLLKTPDEVLFEHVNQLVLQKNCVKCHNSKDEKGRINLDRLDLVMKSNFGKILVTPKKIQKSPLYLSLTEYIGDRAMPPMKMSQLSAEQIELVKVWIENGAKVIKGVEVEPEENIKVQLEQLFLDPEKIDYSHVKKYVFDQRCWRCHSEQSPKAEADTLFYSANLTSYESIFSPFRTVVKKGIPAESNIFEAVAMTQSMPPTKKGFELIDPLEVKLLRLWILNCAIKDFDAIEDDDIVRNPETPEKLRLCEGQ